MGKNRLEAFSDGVIAIIITIMVLELKVPAGVSMADLSSAWHQLFSYLLSFVFLGIYWNNHHHLLQAVKKVNGRILWANMHLLFWLSLVPFGTAWMGETRLARDPSIFYGVVLLCAALGYFLLARSLVRHHGNDSAIARALGADQKGKLSIVLYAVALGAAFAHPLIAIGIYVAVAMMWLVPDRRIEDILTAGSDRD